MTMISKAAMGIAVGIAGIFVGYCFYFDRKRRSDPEFKKKLRERRKIKKKQAEKSSLKFPDMDDHESVQRFFIHEVQLGEEKLTNGDVDGGIAHLANAVAICGQPSQLLQVLQKTLPPQVFYLLLQRLPAIGQKIASQTGMADEELE
ncbi:translocase of outer membrane 20 [Augochlora pura]